jgi:FkbM family methyltransferase
MDKLSGLISKLNAAPPRDADALLAEYAAALNEAFNETMASDIPENDKLTEALNLFSHEYAKLLASREGIAGRKELFAAAADRLLAAEEAPVNLIERLCDVGEIACAASENAGGWIYFKKLRAEHLCDNNRAGEGLAVLRELEELLPNDADIKSMINKALSLKSGKSGPGRKNGCDRDFYGLIELLKTSEVNLLLMEAAVGALECRKNDAEYYGLLSKWYKDWYGVGELGINDKGFVKYFGSMYNYLKQHIGGLVWLYENLENYRSKYQLKTILRNWLLFKPDIREHGIEKTFPHYYDLDIIRCDENEVFVDCGAYDGDSIISFIEQYDGAYKSVYGYEMAPSTYKLAVENTKMYERVFMRNAGVSDKNETVRFAELGGDTQSAGAGSRINPMGNVECRTVRMDDDIQETVTFIKMDVEGAEAAALRGAENHIRRSKPKLAISLYHTLPDLIEIPRLIKGFVPGYRFYLQHCPAKFPFPTEYVLLAVYE